MELTNDIAARSVMNAMVDRANLVERTAKDFLSTVDKMFPEETEVLTECEGEPCIKAEFHYANNGFTEAFLNDVAKEMKAMRHFKEVEIAMFNILVGLDAAKNVEIDIFITPNNESIVNDLNLGKE